MLIAFPNPDGKIAILVPNIDSGLSIQQIILKDIPPNTPYKEVFLGPGEELTKFDGILFADLP